MYSLDISLPKISKHSLTQNSSTIKEQDDLVHNSYTKRNHPKIKTNNNKNDLIKTLHIIHKLDLDNQVDEIYKEEMLLQQIREKINNNNEIREKRLGIFKKKVPILEEEEEEKTQENKIKKLNEKYLEKYGMREKEIKMEKRCI